MAVKKHIIRAVLNMFPVDMKIVNMVMPKQEAGTTQKIEFDLYEGGTDIALKGSFAQQANVVNKDGYKTIQINPMQINEEIADSNENVNKKVIGEDDLGNLTGGMTQAEQREIVEDMKGFAKLKKRALRLIKRTTYELLTTGKVTVSQDGVAVDEVDFGMTNIIVNDNATAGQYQWLDTTNSHPVEQLETSAEGMGEFAPDTFVLGTQAKIAFMAHPKTITADNTTTGKMANFILPTKDEKASKSTKKFKYLGMTTGQYGVEVEVYHELDEYTNASNVKTKYLDKNYAVGFSDGNMDNASLQYGAIPIADGDGENARITNAIGSEWIDGEIKKNPASARKYYRSSPMTCMSQPKSFISIKATLVA